MRVTFLTFDGMTALDALGGYEVLARVPGLEVEFAAREPGVVAADTRRLGLVAWRGFDEIGGTDVVYVPGGPGARALESDPAFLELLRSLDRTSTWTVGICNGVTLLAAAGLLDGRGATGNWYDRERIERYGARFVAARHHRDGKYLTGAGVSASIDAAFFLARTLAGDSVALALQLGLEYFPEPPFPYRSPAEVPEGMQRAVRAFSESSWTTQRDLVPPFSGSYGVLGPGR
jgi:putative intracellular protease/amidase